MPSKYRNIRTDGFASARDARRFRELRLLERAGEIVNLKTQVPFEIRVNDILICKYLADFTYLENGVPTVEDCKGYRTPVYRLKKKLVEAAYCITIKET